jgi:hypothetical protein
MMMRVGMGVLLALGWALAAESAEPLQLRIDTLTVPPATGPLVFVVARNSGSAPYEGEVSLCGPEGWQLTPSQRPVQLAAGETQRIAFNVAEGRNAADNRYAFEITARCGDRRVIHRQEIFVASAPYFSPTIDGQTDDWEDAIPIVFRTGDRETTVSTYWSRRRFALLVAVQEDQLLPFRSGEDEAFDAVQFAISPLESDDGDGTAAGRFEYLLAALPDGTARCYLLADPATPLEECRQPRVPEPLGDDEALVAVRREGGITYYECSLPFRPMNEALRPSEGREFYFSVLVHDPDGTGLRDLGQAAGLWADAGDDDAWSRWPGARWPEDGPRSNRIRWGFCSSKY